MNTLEKIKIKPSKKVTKTEDDYWQCRRCSITSSTPHRMIPCPLGRCEAYVTGTIIRTVTIEITPRKRKHHGKTV